VNLSSISVSKEQLHGGGKGVSWKRGLATRYFIGNRWRCGLGVGLEQVPAAKDEAGMRFPLRLHVTGSNRAAEQHCFPRATGWTPANGG